MCEHTATETTLVLSGAGVPGSCEPPHMSLGRKHWSHKGAVRSLNHGTISLGPAWLFAVLLLIYQMVVPAKLKTWPSKRNGLRDYKARRQTNSTESSRKF